MEDWQKKSKTPIFTPPPPPLSMPLIVAEKTQASTDWAGIIEMLHKTREYVVILILKMLFSCFLIYFPKIYENQEKMDDVSSKFSLLDNFFDWYLFLFVIVSIF